MEGKARLGDARAADARAGDSGASAKRGTLVDLDVDDSRYSDLLSYSIERLMQVGCTYVGCCFVLCAYPAWEKDCMLMTSSFLTASHAWQVIGTPAFRIAAVVH